MPPTLDSPKGPITSAVLAVERMLLESEAFRRRVAGEAEGTYQAARDKIFLFWLRDDPPALARQRPFAVVAPADQLDLTQYAGGQRNYLRAGGQIVVILSDRERYEDARLDGRQSGLDFCGWVDEVLRDLHQMAGRDTFPSLSEITLLSKPARVDPRDEPSGRRYWDCALLLSWHA